MTLMQKKDLITRITSMLEELIDVEPTEPVPTPYQNVDKPLEMLTVKECAALVDGLSEHTVRQSALRIRSPMLGRVLVATVRF